MYMKLLRAHDTSSVADKLQLVLYGQFRCNRCNAANGDARKEKSMKKVFPRIASNKIIETS